MKRPNHFIGPALAAVAAFSSVHAAEDVSWAEILRNPTDVQLNLTFATQRMAAGDMVAAAATLERLLFLQPNWDEARLLYAGVLYRMGDYVGAERELSLLEGRSLSAAAQQDAEDYRRKVVGAQARTRWSGSLSAGIGYDDNAATLITEDVGNTTIATELEQTSFVGRGSLRVTRDLGASRNRALFGQVDVYTKQFEDDEIGGYTVGHVRGGLEGSTDVLDFRVNAATRYIGIQGDQYLLEYGVEASVSRDLGAKSALGVGVSYFDQEFDDVLGAGDTGEGRTGDRVDVSIVGKHAVTPRTRFSARIDYRDKSADISDFSYQFWGAQIGAEYFFGNNAYIDADLMYRDYGYEGAFGAASGDREDQHSFGRLAIGVPLSTFFGGDARIGRVPLIAEAAVYHVNRDSNIDVFAYDSLGAELRLVWNFAR